MRVEEQSVHAPREGLRPHVEIRVSRRLRDVTVVLRCEVLLVGMVLSFGIANPGNADDDWRET